MFTYIVCEQLLIQVYIYQKHPQRAQNHVFTSPAAPQQKMSTKIQKMSSLSAQAWQKMYTLIQKMSTLFVVRGGLKT